MTFSETCKTQRDLLGWSRDTLAKAAGIGTNTVWRIEEGLVTPRAGTMRALRKALNLQPAPAPIPVGTLTVALSEPVIRALREMGQSEMYAGASPEEVAAELLRELVRARSNKKGVVRLPRRPP